MTFTQFFKKQDKLQLVGESPYIATAKLRDILGDRGVVIYDGRLSLSNIREDSEKECLKRGFDAYQVCKGASFTRCKSICPVTIVNMI
jgi:hypothetical protein